MLDPAPIGGVVAGGSDSVLPVGLATTSQNPANSKSADVPSVNSGASGDGKTLVSILQSRNKLNQEQINQIVLESANSGRSVEDLLAEKSWVSDEDMTEARATLLSVPYYGKTTITVSPELMSLITERVARSHNVIPLDVDSETKVLRVLMVHPEDVATIDFLQKRTGHRIQAWAVSSNNLNRLIDQVYLQSLTGAISDVLKRDEDSGEQVGVRVVTMDSMAKIIKEPKIVEIVKKILEHAIKLRASDVHIEPAEGNTRIRYRIDGILEEKLTLDRKYHAALVSRIKILGGMKIDEKRLPQDGRFDFSSPDGDVDLRISTLPTIHGEKVVMRLLKKSGKIPNINELGLAGTALKVLEEAIRIPHGIILATGPTGSGKSTTLNAVLQKLNSPRVNIVTLEDPVEYEIPGVNQVQVNPQAGLTFATGLRSFLRQDPNIIMVGEIRDQETAALAVQASLTGHLVFSTVHTNSAAGALPRLLDMQIESFLLASSMTAVIGQRVLRRICENCRESFVPDTDTVKDVKDTLGGLLEGWKNDNRDKTEAAAKSNCEFLLYRGKEGNQCDKCGGVGYYGRIAIYEVLKVSEKVAKLIMEQADAGRIEKQALEDGMISMRQDGYLKALNGITTLEEVIRVSHA